MTYDFLSGVTVLEVSQFGPDALGGYLSDLGARVIKVEAPGEGDPLRRAGPLSAGEPDGFSFLHLRWNRGKESLELDLRSEQGGKDFRKMVARADLVIEGMRAGGLERLGLGYEHLKKINPKIVFCSVSGMGRSGPYKAMASHGPSFDAFAGLGEPLGQSISRYDERQAAAVGMHSVSLHAAAGVIAALLRAGRTGRGALVEVSAAESAAHWLPEAIDPLLNKSVTHERPGFLDAQGRMRLWARMENYRTSDGKIIFIQCLTEKSWRALINVLNRCDLQAIYDRTPQTGREDSEVSRELSEELSRRPRDEWLKLFRGANVAAMPVNSFEDLTRDPHFLSRDNTYAVSLRDGQILTLMSTPIRVEGEEFSTDLAPELGQHNEAIRAEFGIG